MVILWERELVKGGIHLSDTVKVRALVGSRIPVIFVSWPFIKINSWNGAVLLFPDIPAGTDAHRRQRVFKRGCPDVAV